METISSGPGDFRRGRSALQICPRRAHRGEIIYGDVWPKRWADFKYVRETKGSEAVNQTYQQSS